MANYRYKALNSAGKTMNGVIEADSPAEAQRRLEGRGLRPVQVQLAVLPKQRTYSVASDQRGGAGRWVLMILVVLAVLGAAVWWFDPLGWFPR